MYRIDTTTAAAVLPVAGAPGTPGYFADAPPGSGNTPTVVSSDWANSVQEELAGTVEFAGLALSKADRTQLRQAIQALIGQSAVVGAGAIFGLELANAGGAPTTKITLSAGLCRDSTNTAGLALAAPITKDLTAAWAAGDGAGGRDAGALANAQSWHVFLIYDPTHNLVDALFSQSPTAPTLPANYTKFRRLGAIVLDAAATTIRLFKQDGDDFEYDVRSNDYSAQANASPTVFLRTIAVPTGITVDALLYFQSAGAQDSNAYMSGVFNPAHGVPVLGPTGTNPTGWAQVRRLNITAPNASQTSYGSSVCRVRTDSSGRVYTLSNDTGDVIALGVMGWRDNRGRFF